MRILYLHQYFALPDRNAAGVRSYDIASRLVAAGHEVTVITGNGFLKLDFEEQWHSLYKDGIHIRVYNDTYSNKMSFRKRIASFLRFLVAASGMAARIDADCVLATSTPLTIAIPALYKNRRHKTPFIFEVRDVWPEAPVAIGAIRNPLAISLLGRLERMTYRRSAHIVALSDDMRNSILTRTGTAPDKVSVIPNIAELSRFGTHQAGAGMMAGLIGFQPERSLLYAGTLGKVNGIGYLVDLAVHTITQDPGLVYLVAGDGMEKESLMVYAAERGVLNKNIFFLEPVTKQQLPQLYAECTVASSFVVPIKALWANSANKFFDSLAAGKPVVINYGGWQAAVLQQYDAGLVLDEHIENIAAEAKRLVAYINDADRITQQGVHARRLAEERYSLDVAAGNYLKILEHV